MGQDPSQRNHRLHRQRNRHRSGIGTCCLRQNLHRNLGVDLAPTSIAALSDFKDFLFKWDLLPGNFNIDDWIDHGPLTLIQANGLRKRA